MRNPDSHSIAIIVVIPYNKHMRILTTFAIITCMTLISLASHGAETDLQKNTIKIVGDKNEWPPFIYYERHDGKKTNKLTGYSVDVIREIFTKHGINFSIDLISWNRALHEIKRGTKYHMTLDAYFTEERNREFYFSVPHHNSLPYYFYSRKNHPKGLKISKTSDFERYRICGILGYDYKNYHIKEDTPIYRAGFDYPSLVQFLHLGRCDVFFNNFETIAGFSNIGQHFLKDPDLGYAPMPEHNVIPVHMIFSKTPLGKDLQNLIDTELTAMKSTGRLQEIFDKYIPPELELKK